MAYKPFDLTGKVTLVTGGNRGIGYGMAEALAQAGADVVIWGSNAARNGEAEEKLKAHGGAVLSQTVDVADEQQVVDAMAEANAWKGRLDQVIANAGHRPGRAVVRGNEHRDLPQGAVGEPRRRLLHLPRSLPPHGGAFQDPPARRAAPSSASPRWRPSKARARNEAYAATKGAVISMMKSVAVEHARWGIRANAILPGWIATDMTAGAQSNQAFAEKVIPRVPARRWGEPADFGGIAVYLASDASAYHSGDSFVIDGGYTIF